MPSNADTVLCIDPGEQQMKTIGGPLEGDWKWHGGNLGEELRQKPKLEWVELAHLLLIAKLLHAQTDQHKGVCFPFWGGLAFAAFLNSLDDQPILLWVALTSFHGRRS